MTWIWLAVAVAFEITFALGANAAKGFTRLWPSVLTVVTAAGTIYFLSLALLELDVSIAYTIWTSLGATGTVLLGALLFGERITPQRVGCFVLIILGVVGLQLSDVA
ncbi:MAG: DMT family transporter [Mycobacteriales bacterium]